MTSIQKSCIIYSKVGIENGAKVQMLEAILRGKRVGSALFQGVKKPVNTGATGISKTGYRDEARHGKAFAGLLKRYFN